MLTQRRAINKPLFLSPPLIVPTKYGAPRYNNALRVETATFTTIERHLNLHYQSQHLVFPFFPLFWGDSGKWECFCYVLIGCAMEGRCKSKLLWWPDSCQNLPLPLEATPKISIPNWQMDGLMVYKMTHPSPGLNWAERGPALRQTSLCQTRRTYRYSSGWMSLFFPKIIIIIKVFVLSFFPSKIWKSIIFYNKLNLNSSGIGLYRSLLFFNAKSLTVNTHFWTWIQLQKMFSCKNKKNPTKSVSSRVWHELIWEPGMLHPAQASWKRNPFSRATKTSGCFAPKETSLVEKKNGKYVIKICVRHCGNYTDA